MNLRRATRSLLAACALATTILGAHAAATAVHTSAAVRLANWRFSYQFVASPHDPTFTQLLGINDHQTIVGYDGSGMTVDGVLHPNKGFVLTLPATFMPSNFPNSLQTQVIAINNQGNTGGFYIDASSVTHGFLTNAGNFVTVDLPGTPANQVLGLNNRGQAAGFYQDAAGQNHAIIREADGAFVVPPIPNSTATGINDQGIAIGFTMPTTTTSYGFILRGDAMTTTLDVPNSTFTQPLGENNLGQIVGTFNDANGTTHGFIWHNGAFQTVDVPGSTSTVINGINTEGRIVGFFVDAAGNTIGFVGTPTNANPVALVASLLGKNEVPGPGDTAGGGTALLTLDSSRNTVTYTIAVAGLQGTISMAHIHQGAAGAAGPVVVPFMAPTQGSITGSVSVSHSLLESLAQNPAGFYVNVHTTTFAGGAARGQLAAISTP